MTIQSPPPGAGSNIPAGSTPPTGKTAEAAASSSTTSDSAVANSTSLQTLLTELTTALNSTADASTTTTSTTQPADETPTGSGLSDSQVVTGTGSDPGSGEGGSSGDEPEPEKPAMPSLSIQAQLPPSGPTSTSDASNAAASSEQRSSRAEGTANAGVEKIFSSLTITNIPAYTAGISNQISSFASSAAELGLSSATINTVSASFDKASSLTEKLSNLPSDVSSTVTNTIIASINTAMAQAYSAIVADFAQNPGNLENTILTYTSNSSMTPEMAHVVATTLSKFMTDVKAQETPSSALNTTASYTTLENAIGGFALNAQNSAAQMDSYESFVNTTNANIGADTAAQADVQNANTQSEVKKDEKEEDQSKKKQGWCSILCNSLEIVGAVIIIGVAVVGDAVSLGTGSGVALLMCALAVGMIVSASSNLAGHPISATTAIANGICKADPEANRQTVEIALGSIAIAAALLTCYYNPAEDASFLMKLMPYVMTSSMLAESTGFTTNVCEVNGASASTTMYINIGVSCLPLLCGGAEFLSGFAKAAADLPEEATAIGEIADGSADLFKASGDSGDSTGGADNAPPPPPPGSVDTPDVEDVDVNSPAKETPDEATGENIDKLSEAGDDVNEASKANETVGKSDEVEEPQSNDLDESSDVDEVSSTEGDAGDDIGETASLFTRCYTTVSDVTSSMAKGFVDLAKSYGFTMSEEADTASSSTKGAGDAGDVNTDTPTKPPEEPGPATPASTLNLSPAQLNNINRAIGTLMLIQAAGTVVSGLLQIQIAEEQMKIAQLQDEIQVGVAILSTLDNIMSTTNADTGNIDQAINTNTTNLNTGNANMSQNAASSVQVEFPG